MFTYAQLLRARFPQDEELVSFMMKQGCPHWFFDVPYNENCIYDSCHSCWAKEVSLSTPIK